MTSKLAKEIRKASRSFRSRGGKQSDADELCEAALSDLAILVEISQSETSDEFDEWRHNAKEFADRLNSIRVARGR